MIFRLSAKLATKLKVTPSKALPLDKNPFADWSGHAFTAARTQFVIVTNTASLYSTVFYGRGVPSDSHFIERALSSVREFMEDDGLAFIYQRMSAWVAAISSSAGAKSGTASVFSTAVACHFSAPSTWSALNTV